MKLGIVAGGSHALPASGTAAVLTLTAGILLIYVELNRPGTILPGAFGLTLTLLATATLLRLSPHPVSMLICVAAFTTFAAGTRKDLPLLISAAITAALMFGLATMLPTGRTGPSYRYTALLCGAALGTGTTLLTRIARRARRNKGLN